MKAVGNFDGPDTQSLKMLTANTLAICAKGNTPGKKAAHGAVLYVQTLQTPAELLSNQMSCLLISAGKRLFSGSVPCIFYNEHLLLFAATRTNGDYGGFPVSSSHQGACSSFSSPSASPRRPPGGFKAALFA